MFGINSNYFVHIENLVFHLDFRGTEKFLLIISYFLNVNNFCSNYSVSWNKFFLPVVPYASISLALKHSQTRSVYATH